MVGFCPSKTQRRGTRVIPIERLYGWFPISLDPTDASDIIGSLDKPSLLGERFKVAL